MSKTLAATFINGALQFDEPVDLPDKSRVAVTIRPLSEDEELDSERDDAFESLLQLIRERPIHSGGRHFTREELHERD